MTRPTIEPITESTLSEFAQFLHDNLQQSRSPDEWDACLRESWNDEERPNYGFILRDKGKVVGGIGAYYKNRLINGRTEKICNITSWCVLTEYRQQSMRLAMSVISQDGYSFTDFSPTKVVGATLQFFKFCPLDDRHAVILNLPWNFISSVSVLHLPADIEHVLKDEALQIYKDHAIFPWLNHILVGKSGQWCHIIYKRRVFKGLPAADIYYINNKELFNKYSRRLLAYFLFQGYVSTLVECRFLNRVPLPSVIQSGFNPKLYLSKTLEDNDIDYLYSEIMALDL
jgi:hypothetical protein